MLRIAIGIKEKGKRYVPVGIYVDGSVEEILIEDLNEKEHSYYNELLRSVNRNIFH